MPDPGSTLGYDRYAYVGNNPLKYVDPTGHWGKLPDKPRPRPSRQVTPTPSHTSTPEVQTRNPLWDGDGAANWARSNYENPSTPKHYSNDCTNFVSWALNLGGGLPMDSSGDYSNDWYFIDGVSPDGSLPWINTPEFYSYLTETQNLAEINLDISGGPLNQDQSVIDNLYELSGTGAIQPGDVVFFETYDPNTKVTAYTHAAIVTGWGKDRNGNNVPIIAEHTGPYAPIGDLRPINSSTSVLITNVTIVQNGLFRRGQ